MANGQNRSEYRGKVGINTVTPKATLEIRTNSGNGETTATTNEGILIPRLSKARVAKMSAPEESTLVYINDASGNLNGTVENINEKGYYFYNKDTARWTRLQDSSNKGTGIPTGYTAISTGGNFPIPQRTYECNKDVEGQILRSSEGYFVCKNSNYSDDCKKSYHWYYSGSVQTNKVQGPNSYNGHNYVIQTLSITLQDAGVYLPIQYDSVGQCLGTYLLSPGSVQVAINDLSIVSYIGHGAAAGPTETNNKSNPVTAKVLISEVINPNP